MPTNTLTTLLSIPAVQIGGFFLETLDAVRGVSRFTDVPPVEASPLALIEASLDRTFTFGMNVLTGVPAPETIRRYREELAEARALYAEMGWLASPESFHLRPPPLEDYERVGIPMLPVTHATCRRTRPCRLSPW